MEFRPGSLCKLDFHHLIPSKRNIKTPSAIEPLSVRAPSPSVQTVLIISAGSFDRAEMLISHPVPRPGALGQFNSRGDAGCRPLNGCFLLDQASANGLSEFGACSSNMADVTDRTERASARVSPRQSANIKNRRSVLGHTYGSFLYRAGVI